MTAPVRNRSGPPWTVCAALVLLAASPSVLIAGPPGPPPPETPAASTQADAGTLARTAADIRRLLDGALPDEFPVQSLFEVDLLNEEAVQRRMGELAEEVRELSSQLEKAKEGSGEGEAPARLLEQRLELARLRLAFLQRPLEERRRVNAAEEARRDLLQQGEIARREQARAQAEAEEAENARRRASEEAARAATVLQQSIAAEKARAESIRGAQASFEADLAGRQASEAEHAREQLERILRLEQKAGQVAAGSEEADRLFKEVTAGLEEARPALSEALARYGQPSSVPHFAANKDLLASVDPAIAVQLAELRQLIDELSQRAATLEQQEMAARWPVLELRAERVRRLAAVQQDLLPKLSESEHDRILGVTREGFKQLLAEVEHLRLLAKFYLRSRLHQMDLLPSLVRDIFTVGAAAYTLAKIALLLALVVLLYRRGPYLLRALRRSVLKKLSSPAAARNLGTLFQVAVAVWPQALFLVALWSIHAVLDGAGAWPEVMIAYAVLLWYGWYRFAIQSLFTLVIQVATRYVPGLTRAQSVRVFATIRTLARVVVTIGVFLEFSERFLGRGYLFGLANDFGWVVVLIALLVLLQGWRGDICDAYLRMSPHGRLAEQVRATRDRFQGFFIALVSFALLALKMILVLGRDLALGFDQTRRALAFLFRKRMERRAERSGYAEVDLSSFPPAVLDAFSEEPLRDEAMEIERYPGLESLQEVLGRSVENDCGGSFLVVGERGHGKTTWLNRALREPGLDSALRVDVRTRLRGAPDLVALLERSLGEESARGQSLEKRLVQGSRRVVVVDQCHNLMLRSVGGYDALERFFDLQDLTESKIFWVCTMNLHSWRHIQTMLGSNHPFQHTQELPAWDERSIHDLIRKRTEMSGLSLSYEDLLVEGLEGVSDGTKILETEQGYTRLLWDYADGNPRVAIHFWLRSLVPDGDGSARVRLFKAPETESLDRLSEEERFLLAALMVHENLTVSEAAATTSYTVRACESALSRLQGQKVLVRSAEGRYRVTTHWHRALARFLKRINLLVE